MVNTIALGATTFGEGTQPTRADLETIRPVLQFAFGSNPGATSYNWITVAGLRSVTWQRGKQHELDRVEAGTASLVLSDELRYFDPESFTSPYYPHVKPVVPVRVSIILGGTSYPLFTHYVEELPRVRVGPNWAERPITTMDAFEMLSQASLALKSYPQQLSGARIANALNNAGRPSTNRIISTGSATVTAVTFADSDTTSSLAHIQDVVDDEAGFYFIDAAGRDIFISRADLAAPPYSVSRAVFSDTPDVGEYAYTDAVRTYGKSRIYNDYAGTRAGGTVQAASDATSILTYSRRSASVQSLLTTDADVLALVQYKLAQTKGPVQRFETITVKPANDLGLWALMLDLDLGDRITVHEHPPGGGAASIADYQILGLEAGCSGGSLVTTEFRLALGATPIGATFIFDDPVFGKFDTGQLGF